MFKNHLKTWLIGFIVFALIRTILPNMILGKEITAKQVIVVSACYGLALVVRQELTEMFI